MNESVDEATNTVNDLYSSIGQSVPAAADATIVASMSRLTVAEQLVSDFSQAMSNAPATISSIRSELSQRISAQSSNRASVSSAAKAQIDASASDSVALFAAASSNRFALRTAMANSRSILVNNGTAALLVQLIERNSAAVASSQAIVAKVAEVSSAQLASLSMTLDDESARSEMNCSALAAQYANAPGTPTAAASSRDFTTWFVCLLSEFHVDGLIYK